MDFLFAILLGWLNGRRAARKGYSAWVWGAATFMAYLVASALAMMALLKLLYKGNPMDLYAMMEFMNERVIRPLTVIGVGLGGFLIVRAFIDRLAPKGGGGAKEMDVEG